MTQPVPPGFHTISTHLTVDGAKDAIAFYEKAFGAELVWCNEMPGAGKVMNAAMRIGDSTFMLNDAFPEQGAPGPSGPTSVTIHLYVEDVDTWWKRALDAGGAELFPLMDAFWGDRYGMLKDPFGHQWSIATHVEDVPPEEMDERAAKFMADQQHRQGAC